MNLVVPKVETTASFFVKHFDFIPQISPVKYVAILNGSDGFVLIISSFPNTASYEYPKEFHIGFYQQNYSEVDLLFERLTEDLNIDPAPRKIRDRYGFYFYAPGGILIEITCPENPEIS
jgi:hypothetical protein